MIELALSRGRLRAGSDAARLAHLPHLVWLALWLAGTVGALAWGTVLMLPGVLRH